MSDFSIWTFTVKKSDILHNKSEIHCKSWALTTKRRTFTVKKVDYTEESSGLKTLKILIMLYVNGHPNMDKNMLRYA